MQKARARRNGYRMFISVYILCYLWLVFVMLSPLFIATLWSPAGKRLTSWLSFVVFNCVFVAFPCGILGQVLYYLIVSIPDLCRLIYFQSSVDPDLMASSEAS